MKLRKAINLTFTFALAASIMAACESTPPPTGPTKTEPAPPGKAQPAVTQPAEPAQTGDAKTTPRNETLYVNGLQWGHRPISTC
ncbi:hypothetical protein LJK87_05455 [Paenibacillus sp. P25]|nr:hypothetical protein LJK87_05455 [Paenibacillus sp. P25]